MDFVTDWLMLVSFSYLLQSASTTIPYNHEIGNRIYPSRNIQYGQPVVRSLGTGRYDQDGRITYGNGGQEGRHGGIIILDLSALSAGKQDRAYTGNGARINEVIHGYNEIPSPLPPSASGRYESEGRNGHYRVPIPLSGYGNNGNYRVTSGGGRNTGNSFPIIALNTGGSNSGSYEESGGSYSKAGGIAKHINQIPVTFPRNYGGRSAGAGEGNFIKIVDLGSGKVNPGISGKRGISNFESGSYEAPGFRSRPVDIYNDDVSYSFVNDGRNGRVSGGNTPIIEIRLVDSSTQDAGGIASNNGHRGRRGGTYANTLDGVKESGGSAPIIRIRLVDVPSAEGNIGSTPKDQYKYDFAGTHRYGQQVRGKEKNIGFKR